MWSGPFGSHSGCGFSELNRHGFVGDFERLAIAACMTTPSDEAVLVPEPPIPKLRGISVGSSRAAPSDCRVDAQRYSSTMLSRLGSAVLGLAVVVMAPLAAGPTDRAAGESRAVAKYLCHVPGDIDR